MSRLLIAEPPLQVLRSLAIELGINEAIVVQQMWWLGAKKPGAWVDRSMDSWCAQFPWISKATIERVFRNLRERGWIEKSAQQSWRVAPDHQPEGGIPQSVGENPQIEGGPNSPKKEEQTEGKKKRASKSRILSTEEEPEGFAQWLGQHVAAGATFGLSLSVPRASTARRSALARTFARLRQEGHELEEFRLASLGVVGDAFMREGGHVDPENVLRVEKFGKRVDAGRRVEAAAAAAPVETVDWSRFDD